MADSGGKVCFPLEVAMSALATALLSRLTQHAKYAAVGLGAFALAGGGATTIALSGSSTPTPAPHSKPATAPEAVDTEAPDTEAPETETPEAPEAPDAEGTGVRPTDTHGYCVSQAVATAKAAGKTGRDIAAAAKSCPKPRQAGAAKGKASAKGKSAAHGKSGTAPKSPSAP